LLPVVAGREKEMKSEGGKEAKDKKSKEERECEQKESGGEEVSSVVPSLQSGKFRSDDAL